MNVLFLSQIVPYPPHGGVLQRGYNLLREISRRHQVHLVAWLHRDTLRSPEEIDRSRVVLGEFCASVTYVDVWPKRSKLHLAAALTANCLLLEPFSVTAHRSKAAAAAIERILGSCRIDVVHFDTIGLARYARLAPNHATVLTHHNVESQLMQRRAEVERWPASAYLGLQARKLRAWEARMSAAFDVNVVMSEEDDRLLQTIAPSAETAIVPNGVDVAYFQPDSVGQEPALIYTGGMNMFANRDAVIHFVRAVWPLVKAQYPRVRFDIIGQDPPPELIEMSRADTGLRVHGYVDDIRPYVGKASVYVVPIRVGGGTRLKVLDALAMGKAIVSTSVGCEGIDVVDGRDLIIADESEAMARQVLRLLGDPGSRESLGVHARRLAESRYAWGPIGERLSSVYQLAADIRGEGRVVQP